VGGAPLAPGVEDMVVCAAAREAVCGWNRNMSGPGLENVRRRLWATGIRDRPIRPHPPWANGHAERRIGSIRRECLDHVIASNAAHPRHVLRNYADYYNNDRTHLALGKDSPNSRPVETEEDRDQSEIKGIIDVSAAVCPSSALLWARAAAGMHAVARPPRSAS
jgi:hypothetical protein